MQAKTLLLVAATAALSAMSVSAASAATVIKAIPIAGDLGTINAFNASIGTTYDFTFVLSSPFEVLAQMQASVKAVKKGAPATIEPISFDLYKGTPTGAHTKIDSSDYIAGANTDDVLGSGSYFLQVTKIAVNKELVSGSLELSAVPETATWGMMLLGVAGVGMTLRNRRAAVAA